MSLMTCILTFIQLFLTFLSKNGITFPTLLDEYYDFESITDLIRKSPLLSTYQHVNEANSQNSI